MIQDGTVAHAGRAESVVKAQAVSDGQQLTPRVPPGTSDELLIGWLVRAARYLLQNDRPEDNRANEQAEVHDLAMLHCSIPAYQEPAWRRHQ